MSVAGLDRRFILGEVEKGHFVSLLREYERFCEVEVLTLTWVLVEGAGQVLGAEMKR